jgi:hypothetical protein
MQVAINYGDFMNVIINTTDIARTDLRSASEIWVADLKAELDLDTTEAGLCLWRGEPVVTHDMLSEGTHEQNLRRLWLHVADIGASAEIKPIEEALRERLTAQGLQGEFYPAQQAGDFDSADAERTPG